MPISPGRVAWYVTGRFYLDTQGRLQDLGYFLHPRRRALRSPRAAPERVTQWGTMNADPLAVFAPYTRIAAFTGSAVAAG